MTSRELFILVLRGIGFWAGVRALYHLCGAIANFVIVWDYARSHADRTDGDGLMRLLLASFGTPVVQLLLAACLVFGTVRIAKFFYREPEAAEPPRILAVNSEDLYRTFAQVLGLYCLLWAVYPLSGLVSMAAQWNEFASHPIHVVTDISKVVLYLGCAFGMVFGAKRIARWMSNLRHVPGVTDSSDTPPEANDATKLP